MAVVGSYDLVGIGNGWHVYRNREGDENRIIVIIIVF